MVECKRPVKYFGVLIVLAVCIIATFSGLLIAAIIPAGILKLLNYIDQLAFGGTGGKDAFHYLYGIVIEKMTDKILTKCEADNIFIMGEATTYLLGIAEAKYEKEAACKKDLGEVKPEDIKEDYMAETNEAKKT